MRKFNVNVGGKSYLVEVEELNGDSSPAPLSAPAAAPQQKPKAAEPAKQPAAPAVAPAIPVPAAKETAKGGKVVVSPMPGLILSLAFAEGAAVKKGEKLLVLEAMKMENDIVSPYDGVVHYAVKKGDNVDSGADLAYIG